MNNIKQILQRFIILILLIGLSMIGNAQGTKADSYSLQQAMEYALENNTEIKVSNLDIKYARKQVMETSAIGLPQISGGVNFQNFIDIPTQIAPGDAFGMPGEIIELQFGTEYTSSASITANQLLFDGSYLIGLRAAKVFVELSKKNLQQTEKDVRHNVAVAYYTALISGENYNILKKNLQNLEKVHYEAIQLYENGFTEKLDVDRLALSLSNIRTQLSNAERQKEVSTSLLKFHMGMAQNESIMLTDSMSLMFANEEMINKPSVDFNNRIDYQQLKIQQELARLNMKRYRFNQMPSVEAFFTYSQNAYRDEFNFFDNSLNWYPTTIVGLQINVPIFGLQNTALVQQAKISMVKLDLQKKRLEQAITLEVTRAHTEYANAINQLETQDQNMELAQSIYSTTLIKYKEGVGGSLEVSNAQTELFSTQQFYVQALYGVLLAKSNLNKAISN